MSSIQEVDFDIESVKNSLKENNDRFKESLKRVAFLYNYKANFEQELIERKKKYSDLLIGRGKEQKFQKERGFPIPEPLCSEMEWMANFCT